MGNQQVLRPTFQLVALGLLVLGLFSYFLHVGRLSFYTGDAGRTLVLAVELGVIVLSAVMALMSGRYSPVALFAVAAAYIVFEANLFGSNFHTDVNLNSQSGFFGWFSVLMFSVALAWLPHRRVLSVLYMFTIGYAVFYLALSLHAPGLTPPRNLPDTLEIAGDPAIGRPDRFMLLAGPMAFAVYYSYCKLTLDRKVIYLLPLALCVFDVYISYFRTVAIVIAGVFVLYFFLKKVRVVGLIGSAILFGVMGILLLGLAFPDFHPFALFGARDGSAIIRGLSYEGVRSYAADHWLLGVGFPSSANDVVYIMATRLFFSADLGAVGIFHDAGVVGLVIFSLISLLAANASGPLQALQIAESERDALALTGVACALLGVIAPELWTGTSTIFTGLFLAVWLLAARMRASHWTADDQGRARRPIASS